MRGHRRCRCRSPCRRARRAPARRGSGRRRPATTSPTRWPPLDGVLDVGGRLTTRRVGPRCGRYREAHTEAINRVGPPHKLDVTLPLRALAEFVDEVPRSCASSGTRRRGRGCSATPPTATCTSTSPGVDPDDERSTRRCCATPRRSAAASAPSTASGAPRPSGCRSTAASGARGVPGHQGRARPEGHPQPRRPARRLTAQKRSRSADLRLFPRSSGAGTLDRPPSLRAPRRRS